MTISQKTCCAIPMPTRRTVLTTIITVTCCGVIGTSNAKASTAAEIDQITDPSATAATNMFRFEPDIVRVPAGTTISFLNSRSDHTVHSVPELWPDGVNAVGISASKRADVLLPHEGLYFFRCQRHGQYGMVMLAVAGDPVIPDDLDTRIEAAPYRSREIAALADLVKRL